MMRSPLHALHIVCTDNGQHPSAEVAYLRELLHRHYGDLDVERVRNVLEEEVWEDADGVQYVIKIGEVGYLRARKSDGRPIMVNRKRAGLTRADGGITYRFKCPRCGRDEARREEWVERLFAGFKQAGVSRIDISTLPAARWP